MFPPAYDWDVVFRPATLALLSGQPMPNGFFSPIWVLFPLIPFALLPYEIGRLLICLCGIAAFGYAAHRMGAKLIGVIAFALSPLVIVSLYQANVEWLVLLGFVTVSPINILLFLIKPQMTIIVILFLLWQAWKENHLMRLVIVPSLAIGFATACGWIDVLTRYSSDALVNSSLFPFSLAIGLPLTVYAFRHKQVNATIAASPCFAPTLSPQSWLIALFAIVRSTPEMVATWIGLWLCVIVIGLR